LAHHPLLYNSIYYIELIIIHKYQRYFIHFIIL
jgi:hypothetical protein